MNIERAKYEGSGALLAIYDELAEQEERAVALAARLYSVETVIAGRITAPSGLRAPEDRLLVLSALKFGLIVAGVFLAGVVAAVAAFAALGS